MLICRNPPPLPIADSDADAALEYVGATGYDDDLLTDEVLARSRELGAIDDIEVGKASESESDVYVVPATFTIGGVRGGT